MLDKSSLMALKEIMGSDFKNLIDIFIEDSEARIKQLGNLLKTDNADEIRKMAHSIKGSSGNLYATRMSDFCLDLEKQAHENDLRNANTLHQQIAEEFILVKNELLKHWY